VSGPVTKQGVDCEPEGALARFPGLLKDTVTANPELFLPVFLLFVWQASAISVKPTTLGLALVLTFVLLIYAYRVLGTTPWLRRLGWVAPRAKGFGSMASLQAVSQALPYGGLLDCLICRSAAFHGQMYCCSRAHPAQSWRRCSFEVCSSR
jgi:hypothetical protein